MDRFKDFQRLVHKFSDTGWLVDCAAMPSEYMQQAHVDQIVIEIIRREVI